MRGTDNAESSPIFKYLEYAFTQSLGSIQQH